MAYWTSSSDCNFCSADRECITKKKSFTKAALLQVKLNVGSHTDCGWLSLLRFSSRYVSRRAINVTLYSCTWFFSWLQIGRKNKLPHIGDFRNRPRYLGAYRPLYMNYYYLSIYGVHVQFTLLKFHTKYFTYWMTIKRECESERTAKNVGVL